MGQHLSTCTSHLKNRFSVNYSQVHNKWGGQIKRGGGFKDFEKLLNGEVKMKGGWEQSIKEMRRK